VVGGRESCIGLQVPGDWTERDERQLQNVAVNGKSDVPAMLVGTDAVDEWRREEED
jgi:hypothetical protein